MGKRISGEKSLFSLVIIPRVFLFILLHTIFVLNSVSKKVWTLRESTSIYIFNVGGFGHTISQPDTYFNYIDPDGKVIALLTPGVHNLSVSSLYLGNYYVIDRTKYFSLIKLKKERLAVQFSELVALKIISFFNFIYFKLPQIYDWRSLVSLVPDEKIGTHGKGILELFYNLSNEDKNAELVPNLQTNHSIHNDLINKLRVKFPGKRFCAFYFRSKGIIGLDNIDDYTRNTRSLIDFMPIFRFLQDEGMIILLYGDEPQTYKDEARASGVVFSEDVSLEKNLWDLWAGVIGEFTIGSPGGGLLIPVKFRKKILVIDGFGFWFAVPRAMLTYKLVYTADKELISPLRLVKSNPWQLKFPQGSTIEFLPAEVLFRVMIEFYSKLNNWPTPDDTSFAHEECWITISPDAFISVEYITFINSILRIKSL
jgi:hypothetical protein